MDINNIYNHLRSSETYKYNQGGSVGDQWSQYGQRIGEQNNDVLSGVNTVLDFIPIIGDAKAAKEVWDEMQKPEPNWALVGALGGAALIGLIPGIGDAAAAAIKVGAKAGLKGVKASVAVSYTHLTLPTIYSV